MIVWLSILAALIGAISSGIATVLQKISADKAARATTMDAGLLFRLIKDWPYFIGIVLDLVCWVLSLVAVHNLALFVVQPILAFAVVATVLVERLVFHHKLSRQTIIALTFLILGLVLLGITAAPEVTIAYSSTLKMAVVLSPLLLIGLGSIFAKISNRTSTILLALFSGVAFGFDSVAGRMIIFNGSYLHLLVDPLFWSVIAYGIIAILLLTIALQRQLASIVMAVVLTSETIASVIIGLLYLGDHPRHGLWLAMIVGGLVATIGTVVVAVSKPIKK